MAAGRRPGGGGRWRRPVEEADHCLTGRRAAVVLDMISHLWEFVSQIG
jgi:hypothetical protein